MQMRVALSLSVMLSLRRSARVQIADSATGNGCDAWRQVPARPEFTQSQPSARWTEPFDMPKQPELCTRNFGILK